MPIYGTPLVSAIQSALKTINWPNIQQTLRNDKNKRMSKYSM